MRSLTRVFISIAIFSFTVGAQIQAADPEVLQLGTKTVRIPPPEGFVATFGRFTRLRDRFLSGQAPGVTVTEVHVPASVISELEKNEDISLSFYSRVSVPDSSRAKDTTAAEFRTLVTGFEKQHDALFDAKGPTIREAGTRVRQGLDKHYDTRTGLKLDQSTSLGYFQREPNVFSGMILQPIEIYGQRMLLLAGFSFLHLKGRTIYVQVYRKFTEENDAAILRDSVLKWTTAILAVNK